MDDVVSSTLLGSPGFIAFIKDKYLSGKKPDKELPALKELSQKPSTQDIVDEVEAIFSKEKALAKNIKMYLCQRYTRERLKDIGSHFGIGESGVSQASRRVAQRIEKDKKLKKRIDNIEKKLHVSKMKTPLFHNITTIPTPGYYVPVASF